MLMTKAQTLTRETQPILKIEQLAIVDTQRQTLKEVLELAKVEKKRLTLVYENTLFLTVVPVDDVEMVEKLEKKKVSFLKKNLIGNWGGNLWLIQLNINRLHHANLPN